MSSLSSARVLGRTAVLRGDLAGDVRPARMDLELSGSRFDAVHAAERGMDPRLVDPHLEQVVAAAAEQARAAGRQQGYDDGYQAGAAAAAAEAAVVAEQHRRAEADRRAQAQAALAALAAATDALTRREALGVQEVEDVVAAAAFELAAVLLQRELAVAADPGRDAIARAMALLPPGVDTSAALVRLHPEDLHVLEESVRDGAARPVAASVQLVADPSVERGGCVVETAGRTVDAQLGPALERVRQELLG
jgi:flagellar assembly protein FliH